MEESGCVNGLEEGAFSTEALEPPKWEVELKVLAEAIEADLDYSQPLKKGLVYAVFKNVECIPKHGRPYSVTVPFLLYTSNKRIVTRYHRAFDGTRKMLIGFKGYEIRTSAESESEYDGLIAKYTKYIQHPD